MTIGKMNIISSAGLTIEFGGCKLISKINSKDLIAEFGANDVEESSLCKIIGFFTDKLNFFLF